MGFQVELFRMRRHHHNVLHVGALGLDGFQDGLHADGLLRSQTGDLFDDALSIQNVQIRSNHSRFVSNNYSIKKIQT
jgi:hypothetical protein